jgi:hypothetical protein
MWLQHTETLCVARASSLNAACSPVSVQHGAHAAEVLDDSSAPRESVIESKGRTTEARDGSHDLEKGRLDRHSSLGINLDDPSRQDVHVIARQIAPRLDASWETSSTSSFRFRLRTPTFTQKALRPACKPRSAMR